LRHLGAGGDQVPNDPCFDSRLNQPASACLPPALWKLVAGEVNRLSTFVEKHHLTWLLGLRESFGALHSRSSIREREDVPVLIDNLPISVIGRDDMYGSTNRHSFDYTAAPQADPQGIPPTSGIWTTPPSAEAV